MTIERICFVSLSAYNYFCSDSPVSGGGSQRQLSILANKLTDEFSVHFIVGDYGQPDIEIFNDVVLHSAYTPDADASTVAQVWKLAALRDAVTCANADVYIHRGHPQQAAVVFVLARLVGAEFIYNLSNDKNLTDRYDGLNAVRRRLFRWGLRNARTIIAQTETQRKQVRRRFNRTAVVVPNGYPLVDDHYAHSEREFFLWVGRIDRNQKRPHLYLDLAERCPTDRFLLIGTQDNQPDYYNRIHHRAVNLNNVTFIGAVNPDDIHDYYRRAIALVNTSAYEGFPNSFLEAARYATPVLSLDVDVGRFLASEGYAHGSLDRLAELTQMLTDYTNLIRQGAVVQRIFESTYDIETVWRQYRNALLNGVR